MQRMIACDDEEEFLEILNTELNQRISWPYTLMLTSSTEKLEELLEQSPSCFDILFMDIKMYEKNGIDLAARLQKSCPQLKVIFVTGYVGEYYEALFLKLRPFGVLAKPVNWDNLLLLLNKARTEEEIKRCLTVTVQAGLVNIDVDTITYIESIKRTTLIHTREDRLVCYGALTELNHALPANFLRCHKSFIVNMDYIKTFLLREIRLWDDTVITVSKARAKDSKTAYFTYIGMRL